MTPEQIASMLPTPATCRAIPLHGRCGVLAWTLVDDVDFGEVSQFRWRMNCSGYAIRSLPRKGAKKTNEFLHRNVAVRAGLPIDGIEGDHVNGDRLDNRRANIRPATRAQNARNTRRPRHSKAPFKGITVLPSGRWRAQIKVDGRRCHLGTYDTAALAHEAYCAAARLHFGDFARMA